MLEPLDPAELGRVISIRGPVARIGMTSFGGRPQLEPRITVGNFVSIAVLAGAKSIIGMITEVSCEAHPGQGSKITTASIDMLGEIEDLNGQHRFRRGVTDYPMIGDKTFPITAQQLRIVYAPSEHDQISIGTLQQDRSIIAQVNVEEMLSKHFAILGSTGVGKSSSVSLLLNEILKARPHLRVFVLDVHNEYGRCFGDRALVLNPRSLRLPFWLFNFEEMVDVLFSGRPGLPDELDVLTELIPAAKNKYRESQQTEPNFPPRPAGSYTGATPDTPIPYRLTDLIALLEERIGKLENRAQRMSYYKLIGRIETIRNDPRYQFMFNNANVGGDTMADVIATLFRLPTNGQPMTVMQLAGFPAEVVDSVVSVLCRMAFEFGLWSNGASPMLFFCEEAHRYASADRSTGFGPTRKAISRIAKEGRKYGVYLGIVTQRPAELDATIISQCNTLFAMRLVNERDQALLRSAVPDASSSMISFLSSLGTREVLAFGEGLALPTRLRFKEIPPHQIPRSEATIASSTPATMSHDIHFVSTVLDRWRAASTRREPPKDKADSEMPYSSRLPQQSLGGNEPLFSPLLKKPLR